MNEDKNKLYLTSQPFAWILLPKIVDAQVPSWSRLEQVSSLKVFIVVQHCFVFLGSTLTHFLWSSLTLYIMRLR